MHIAGRVVIAGWLSIVGAMGAEAEQALAQITERREAAVLRARAGQLEPAITALRAMLAAGEDDGLVAMDLAALLQQAHRAGEAIAVYERAAVADPPDYALLAAARAYRDARRYRDAEKLARQGLKRFPDQTTWPLLLALVLTDVDRPKEALEVLSGPEAQRAPPIERRLAEGYAWRRAGDPYKALSAYTDALKLVPANKEARDAAAALLQAQGGSYGAAALAGTTRPYAADQAAAMVRWGTDTRPSDPAQRFDATDAAIARLDGLLAALSPPPAEAAARRRLRLDRLVALRDRVRMEEAATEGRALQSGGPLPPFAEEAYADALLYLRRPEEASAAYRRVLAGSQKDVPAEMRIMARYGLYYASVELEDFETAYATIDALVDDQPIWRMYRDDPTRHGNPDRAYAEVTAAAARNYGNQLADAWARITRIADAAPANKWARLTLYQVSNARGWPRRAETEGEIAASLDPDSVGSRIALAEIAMANYRFAEAQRRVGELLALYPENSQVRRLARELQANTGWVLEAEAKPSSSHGGGANAAGNALTMQTRLTTSPIADNWRLFAVTDYANAHPPEGFVERTRLSAGLEWRVPYLTATLYPTQSWGTLAKAGGGATLDWRATDQIRLAFSSELYSWDTPLRALLHGITADSYSMKATYRWDESRSLSGTLSYLPFTDGNQRFNAGAVLTQKVISVPHFDLTATGEVFTSQNNRPAAPYYNPDHDLTVDAGLLAEHVIWRRYDSSWAQALSVNAGLYDETHFSPAFIATVSYEHRWRFDPFTELHYGLQLQRRVYDGSVENTAELTLGMLWKFF